MSAPRMTTQQSAQCEPKSFEGSVLSECFDCVLRASGSEPASWRREWRNVALVDAYWGDEHLYEQVGVHEDSGVDGDDDSRFSCKRVNSCTTFFSMCSLSTGLSESHRKPMCTPIPWGSAASRLCLCLR